MSKRCFDLELGIVKVHKDQIIQLKMTIHISLDESATQSPTMEMVLQTRFAPDGLEAEPNEPRSAHG